MKAKDWIQQGKVNQKALELDYDYTQVAPGSTAMDSFNQIFYCIISNPNYENR